MKFVVHSHRYGREFLESSDSPNEEFVELKDAINDIKLELRGLTLDDNFDDYIDENVYLRYFEPLPEPQAFAPTPMPNTNIISQVQPQQFTTAQGLTPTELALLSPEEQQIRLRQRGLA